MKTIKSITATALMALAIIFASCSKDEVVEPASYGPGGSSHELNSFDQAGLLELLETCKMHRDVYNWIYSKYNVSIFPVLAEEDEQNMFLLSVRVDKYGIPNPLEGRGPGEFSNASVKEKYLKFVKVQTGNLGDLIEKARDMEADMVTAAEERRAAFSGSEVINQLYSKVINESNEQIRTLSGVSKATAGKWEVKPETEGF